MNANTAAVNPISRTRVRESNLELLRCILMIMVVGVHYNGDLGGVLSDVAAGSANYYIAHFFEILYVCCVNGFILITGWYSSKKTTFSLRKPVGLLIYLLAYNFLFYFISVLSGTQILSLRHILSSFIPQNWYVILYITLIILSPYINMVINQLSKHQFTVLIIVLISLFSLWTTACDLVVSLTAVDLQGISTVSLSGAEAGYSIVNFVMLYIIGTYLKIWYKANKPAIFYALIFLALSIVSFGFELITPVMRNYNNIFVILQAVSLILAFSKIHIGSNRIINTIAAGTFGIYLIHTYSIITNTYWGLFNIKSLSTGSTSRFLLMSLLCIISTYVICLLFDIICRSIAKPVSKLMDKWPLLNRVIIDTQDSN